MAALRPALGVLVGVLLLGAEPREKRHYLAGRGARGWHLPPVQLGILEALHHLKGKGRVSGARRGRGRTWVCGVKGRCVGKIGGVRG